MDSRPRSKGKGEGEGKGSGEGKVASLLLGWMLLSYINVDEVLKDKRHSLK